MPYDDKPSFGPKTGFRFLDYDIYPNDDGGLTVLDGIKVMAQIDPQKTEEFKNFIVAANDAPVAAAEEKEKAGVAKWQRAALEFAKGHLIFTEQFVHDVKCNNPEAAFQKLGYVVLEGKEARKAIDAIKMSLRIYFTGTNADGSEWMSPEAAAEIVHDATTELKDLQQYREFLNYFEAELYKWKSMEKGRSAKIKANYMRLELDNLIRLRGHWSEIVKMAQDLVDRHELFTTKPAGLKTIPPGQGSNLHTILTRESLTGPDILQALKDTWFEDNTPGIRIMAVTNMIEDFLKSRGIKISGTAEEAVESLLALIADPLKLKEGKDEAEGSEDTA